MDEIRLPGGNVGGAVLVGNTVRRPTGPWTPAVHELLGFLAAAGLPLVPRALGIDERDREILTYLPGEVVPIGERELTDAQLTSTARWLREYHRVVADFPRGSRRWRFVETALAPGQIICHHDMAMYNLAFDGDELVGVFDWDVAGPGVPLDDLAMLAWASPLLHPDDDARRMAHGLRVLADGYGDVDPVSLLRHVEQRMTDSSDRISAGQRAGDAGMLNLRERGEPAATLARLRVLIGRTDELVDAIAHG
ncbi:phosphotransferase [Cellulomonas composti]|uniref:Aminoglycoside phosphotransferase domain-containing protein n=1 Tax=Cellulomonas composti TaxID=266130 RepID=A0A511JCI0_9CELL|nr:phosphotransferase [Cellulomonas composti]GEL95684.1 hypothetical protein CCO02nite_23420 [Cellulomonas composti]